ncbi:MAG: hypothetical protein AAGF77_09090 [Bacteroidota bacterium]
MSTLEIKKKLRQYINEGDELFVKMLYDTAKDHMHRLAEDKLMAESEEDIKAGRLHTMDEVQNMIKDWTKT